MSFRNTRGELVQLSPEITRVLRQAANLSPLEAAQRSEEAMRVAEKDKRSEWQAAFFEVVRVRARRHAMNPDPARWPGIPAIDDWLPDAGKRNLMLRGATRTGKTVAAAYAIWRWLEPGMHRGRALFLNPDQLISAMLHDYDESSPATRGVRLAVVDDIACETKPGFSEALRRLLDYDDVSVVMTTNLDRSQFRGRYPDSRLLRRLLETSDAVDLPGRAETALPENGDF